MVHFRGEKSWRLQDHYKLLTASQPAHRPGWLLLAILQFGRVAPAHARHLTPRRGASAGPRTLLPHFSRSPFIVNDRGIIRGEFLYIDRLAGRYYCFTNLARCHAVVQFAPREARSCDETWPHRLNGDLSSYGRLIWMNRRACRLSGCLSTSRIHGTGPKRRFIADLTIFHG